MFFHLELPSAVEKFGCSISQRHVPRLGDALPQDPLVGFLYHNRTVREISALPARYGMKSVIGAEIST